MNTMTKPRRPTLTLRSKGAAQTQGDRTRKPTSRQRRPQRPQGPQKAQDPGPGQRMTRTRPRRSRNRSRSTQGPVAVRRTHHHHVRAKGLTNLRVRVQRRPRPLADVHDGRHLMPPDGRQAPRGAQAGRRAPPKGPDRRGTPELQAKSTNPEHKSIESGPTTTDTEIVDIVMRTIARTRRATD